MYKKSKAVQFRSNANSCQSGDESGDDFAPESFFAAGVDPVCEVSDSFAPVVDTVLEHVGRMRGHFDQTHFPGVGLDITSDTTPDFEGDDFRFAVAYADKVPSDLEKSIVISGRILGTTTSVGIRSAALTLGLCMSCPLMKTRKTL
jgi:hypothetical protein